MADREKPIWEVVTQDGNFPVENEEDNVQLSESELRAMEKGWKPQSEWDGNPEEWRSAKEYLDRGSLFEKINNQRKELDEMRRFQKDAEEHLRKLRAGQERDRLNRLNDEKRNALMENDIEQVMKADQQIRQVETELAEIDKPSNTNTYNPEEDRMFDEWKDDNPWYEKDTELRILADALGTSFRANNPNATPQDVYSYVTEKVKSTNPSKFSPSTNNAQSRSPNSTTQYNRNAKGHGKTYHDLSEDQLKVGRRFTRLGLYNDIQGYVDDLVSTGEL